MADKFRHPSPILNETSLSSEWLEQMISNKLQKKIKVIDWDIKTPEGREGFLSEIRYVKVQYFENDKTIQVGLVFKFLPDSKDLLDFMDKGKLQDREIHFYKFALLDRFQNIIDNSGIEFAIPNVYYSLKVENIMTLVMEDLNHLNYKTIIIPDGSTLNQTIKVLESAAVIHAAGYSCIQNNEHIEVKSNYSTEFYDIFLVPNLKTISDMFKDTDLCQIFLDLIPFTEDIRSHKLKHELFKTVIHGDLWAGQCLFSEDESECCIIDWQFSELSNPVLDIVSMLFMSTDPYVIENNLDEILIPYHTKFVETLRQSGIIYPLKYEDLKSNVIDNFTTGFMYIAASIHDFLGSKNITEKRIRGLMEIFHKNNVFTNILKKKGR